MPAQSHSQSFADALKAIDGALAAGSIDAPVQVHGAAGALGPAVAAHVAARYAGEQRGPLIYVVADDERAEARVANLTFFLGVTAGTEDPLSAPAAAELPAPESSPYAEMQADRRSIMQRLAMLYRLSHDLAPKVVVASAAALFRKVIPPGPFRELCGAIETGTTVDREALLARLTRAGYGRTQIVEDPGTFAVRGSIIDVFPPVYRHPLRIELFGDEVESVRLYDAATQRTLRSVPRMVLHPVRETVRTAGGDPRTRVLAAADAAAFPSSKTRHLLEQIDEGGDFFGIEALAPAFHAAMVPFFDYLPADAVVVVEDPDAVADEVRRGVSRLRESAHHRHAEHRLALDPEEFFLDETQADAVLKTRRRVELRTLEIEEGEQRAAENENRSTKVHLHAESNATLRAELLDRRTTAGDDAVKTTGDPVTDIGQALRGRILEFLSDSYRVRLVAPNRTHGERLLGVLKALGLNAKLLPARDGHRGISGLLGGDDAASVAVLVGPLSRGFRLPGDRLALIAEEEIFGARAHREPRTTAGMPGLGDLGEIAEGDAVVHDEHGVGRYRGLKKLEMRGVAQDFLHLEYDGGAVYVPVYRIGMVHRYVGGDGETARIDKLGGKTWQEKRRRVSADARKIAEELLQLYAQRQALRGHAFPPPDVTFREFEETFPFDETPDQARAIEATLNDMQQARPMDRLICGDVGYGKTEIALRAALLAVLDGKQVAVLAPTTVLVEQHLVTFSERMRDFPVRVASLSRFRSAVEQRQTVAAIGEGKVDIIIGTHRVLSRDVRFKNLGLVVIDEEQRFGVTHKERLKELRSQVDVLTLTATPIPRTLQMALTGMREISIIATPPVDRLAIRTFVCRFDRELLGAAIEKELKRGGQIFFVHNRIEDLEKWRNEVQALAPNARVGMGHGQMAAGALEKVMIDFVDGRYDILVCTTIIESGLDIPRANTMIVNQAERFGLAQLYQMRGRIGRSKERAFCYLVVRDEGALPGDAKQRLAVLQRFTELGAGFQVATHDLEIRGAGELLGEKQSGALADVGFETYARILEEAVAELRGAPIKQERDPEIAVDVPAFLPDDYIPDTGQRLDFYRRLAQANDDDGVRAVMEELTDRYGELPEEATLLAEVMGQKTLVRRIGALSYELGPARMVLSAGTDSRLAPAKVMKLVQAKTSRWKLSPDMRLSYAFDDREKMDHLAAAREHLEEVLNCLT